jgi:predicted RNase H-like HicB family nuclease
MATVVSPKQVTLPDGFQMFTLVYQCQRCLGKPEAFLIRRDVWTFYLEGRSPIERVEVPKFVPEKEQRYYSDAVVAFNSGKVLAALFYLRTFVEQFARRITGKTGRATGEEILDAYYETLPSSLKSEMPSLREWYENLSVPIHAGKDDTEVFTKAKEAIDKHFEIRRVFRMDEPEHKASTKTESKEESKEKSAEDDKAPEGQPEASQLPPTQNHV